MSTALVYDATCLSHDTGHGHPERPDRIRAIMQYLRQNGLLKRCKLIGPMDTGRTLMDAINEVHDPEYVERMQAACMEGESFIDVPDSAICEASYHAALISAACAVRAVDVVARGDYRNSICLMRPPGHHCERDESMGFCLLNNTAIATQWLVDRKLARRVAIVDFDVHHGNGTQHIFEDRDDILYCSIHQHPMTLFPGTGHDHERGMPGTPGFGTTVNVPVIPGAGDDMFIAGLDHKILPALYNFRPDYLILGAGFDAHIDDPLAQCKMTTDGYEVLSRRLVEAAEELCEGRLTSVLEGGYHLASLAESCGRHIEVLLEAGDRASDEDGAPRPEEVGS